MTDNQSPAEALRQQLLEVLCIFEEELQFGLPVNIDKPKVDNIMELVTAYAATVEREAVEAKEKEWLKTYLTMLLEAYKGVRPVRPEDLTMSQWHGLVEGIDAGISEVEKSLAALQGPPDEIRYEGGNRG